MKKVIKHMKKYENLQTPKTMNKISNVFLSVESVESNGFSFKEGDLIFEYKNYKNNENYYKIINNNLIIKIPIEIINKQILLDRPLINAVKQGDFVIFITLLRWFYPRE